MIDERLLELLACPACEDRPPVRLVGETLVCDECGRAYPIRDGIPEMLVESAVLPESPEASATAAREPGSPPVAASGESAPPAREPTGPS